MCVCVCVRACAVQTSAVVFVSVLFRMEDGVGLYASVVQTFSSVLQQLPGLEIGWRSGGVGGGGE